jgi:hypothetical protein
MPMTRGDSFKPYTLDVIFDEAYDKEYGGKFRKIEMDNGNTCHIRCQDPYGFWYISLERGNLPERMKGSYTSFDLALRAVNMWLKDKPEPYIAETVQSTKRINKAVLERKEVVPQVG